MNLADRFLSIKHKDDEIEFLKGLRRTQVANTQLEHNLEPDEFEEQYEAFKRRIERVGK